MNALDIVKGLAALLPQQTALFTDDVAVVSLVRAGTVITVTTTTDHGLEVGDSVAITGAVTQIPIIDMGRSGTVGTLETGQDHDLTNAVAPTITISGATESEFNGTFTRLNIDTRTKITFTMADSGPTVATGSPILEGAESPLRDYNTTYSVDTVPSTTTFTITQTDTTLLDPIGTITARIKPRISAGVNPDRLMASYTEKSVDELWLFVVLDDVTASKSRNIRSDAVDNIMRGSNFRQQIIQGMTLYLFVPASTEIAAAAARDQAESLFRAICQSVLDTQFDSGLFEQFLGSIQFVAHGAFAYNTSVYVHGYTFQQVVDLYEQDTVGPDLDVAFRDICLIMDWSLPSLQDNNPDSASSTADIVLDDGDVSVPFNVTGNVSMEFLIGSDHESSWLTSAAAVSSGFADNFSCSVWIYPQDVTVEQMVYACHQAGSTANGFELRIMGATSGDPFRVTVKGFGSNDTKTYEFGSAVLNTWTQVAFTYDGTTLIVYQDGAVETPNKISDLSLNALTNPNRQFGLGAVSSFGSDDPLSANLHSVGVWDETLSSDAISATWNSGNGEGFDISSDSGAYTSSSALVGWRRCGFATDPDWFKDYGSSPMDPDSGAGSNEKFDDADIKNNAPT